MISSALISPNPSTITTRTESRVCACVLKCVHMCVHVCVCVYTHLGADAHGNQKGALNALEVALQTVVKCLIYVLGTKF